MEYTVDKLQSNKEIATLIGLFVQDSFRNPLLLGDLCAPMNQHVDAYKVINQGGHIQTGFTVFHASDVPVVIFPSGHTEHWPAIKSKVNELQYKTIRIIYPVGLEEEKGRQLPPPWLQWNEYAWEAENIDLAMKFTKEELEIVDIEGLPKIRGASKDDVELIQSFLNEHSENHWFHPTQLESDLSVIAEHKEQVVGFAGTHFEAPYTVQLGNLFIHPEYRNQGLGTALTTAVALGIIRSRRVPTLFVDESNTSAIQMYEKIGFEVYNRFAFYKGYWDKE